MTSLPVVAEDKKSAFEPFVLDFPAAAPAARLPAHVLSTFQAFVREAALAGKRLAWKVGHVPPIGWFILHENGAPVYIENTLAMPAFWRLHDADQLKMDPEIDAQNKRMAQMRQDVDAGHLEREADKHVKDLNREMVGHLGSRVYMDPPDTTDEAGNVPNQQKPAGLTSGATPDPANPNIEADKAASTSSISSDSMGAPGNKTIQPHGSPDAIVPPRSVSNTNLAAADQAGKDSAPLDPPAKGDPQPENKIEISRSASDPSKL